jgi:hypothetical protein
MGLVCITVWPRIYKRRRQAYIQETLSLRFVQQRLNGHGMNTADSRSSLWLRFCINASFVLVLLGAVLAKVAAAPAEWTHGKALQQTISEIKGASNGFTSDPPEVKSGLPAASLVVVPPVPQVLGVVQHQQFSPMVHQLRDRLMHAPPVLI